MLAGMRLIQILPVNDTSVHRMWWDSYPYSSLSVRCTGSVVCGMRRLNCVPSRQVPIRSMINTKGQQYRQAEANEGQ